MSKIFIEDYINKVMLLEKQVGAKIKYEILEPFPIKTSNIIDIQIAAKKIAEFIGLYGFTFIIATAKQKEKVGGHIELEYGQKEVFIEISNEILKFNRAVLATLAHEITHKYLQINRISCGTGPINKYENEVLTDIAAVFLGLGKLMLNGCKCQIIRQENLQVGTRTITETLKVGYLDRSQLAFVYCLVCAMRKIPSIEYEKGLSIDSIQSLRECKNQYGYYFDNQFHEPDINRRSVEHLLSVIYNAQVILSNIDKNLLYLQGSCVKFVETFLIKTHKKLKELLEESQKMGDDNEIDPCLKYLKALQLDQTVAKLVSEIGDYSSEAEKYQNNLNKLINVIQSLNNFFPKPSADMFTIATCRNDGTKIRLPKDRAQMIVKCPTCQYLFIADSTIPKIKKLHVIKKESLLKKILKSLFRKK